MCEFYSASVLCGDVEEVKWSSFTESGWAGTRVDPRQQQAGTMAASPRAPVCVRAQTHTASGPGRATLIYSWAVPSPQSPVRNAKRSKCSVSSTSFYFELHFFCAVLSSNKENLFETVCAISPVNLFDTAFVFLVILVAWRSTLYLHSRFPCWVTLSVSVVIVSVKRIGRFNCERVPIKDFITSGLKEIYCQVSITSNI